MIKLFTSSSDTTSDEVQDWLEFFGHTVSRENDFPIKECVIYSIETGFVVNKEKVEAINLVFWNSSFGLGRTLAEQGLNNYSKTHLN